MIAEPYINERTGEIEWHKIAEPSIGNGLTKPTPYPYGFSKTGKWIPYADFERDVLKRLGGTLRINPGCGASFEYVDGSEKDEWIGTYSGEDYHNDTESGRLLQRAKFLKAVCEKEQVPFLPKMGMVEFRCFNPACPYFAGVPYRNLCEVKKELDNEIIEKRKEQHRWLTQEEEDEIMARSYKTYWSKSDKELRAGITQLYNAIGRKAKQDYYTKEEIDERMKEIWKNAALMYLIGGEHSMAPSYQS